VGAPRDGSPRVGVALGLIPVSTAQPGSIPPKPVLLFAVHALVLSLLIGYWPSARAAYPAFFRAGAQLVLGSGEAPLVTVREATGSSLEEKDTFVEAFAGPEADEPIWRLVTSALRLGYWPSAVLLALLLATPMSVRARWLSAVGGLLWLHAFALARLGLEVLRASAELESGQAVEAGGALLAYRTLSEVSNSNIVVIATVFLGWVVVARPRQSLEMRSLARLLGQGGRRVP